MTARRPARTRAEFLDELYRVTLDRHQGNLTRAAQELDVHFNTLWRWKNKTGYCFMVENGTDSAEKEKQA